MKYKYYKKQLQISRLGYGLAKLPLKENNELDEKTSIKLIKIAIEKGINFFDTAYTYLNGKSEIVLGKALEGVNREKICISTKAPVWLYKDKNDFYKILYEQLERLNTDYIDFYLIHGINRDTWNLMNKYEIMDCMAEAKKLGLIRNIGFSFQDTYTLFKKIVDSYDWDLCMLRLNILENCFEAGLKGLEYAKKKNIPVVAMQPFQGGTLIEIIEKLYPKIENSSKYAFNYLWKKNNILTIIPSMTSKENLKKNIEIENEKLESDTKIVKEIHKKYNDNLAIKCNGCSECIKFCKNNVAIPYVFLIYNYYKITNNKNNFKKKYEYTILKHGNTAEQCSKCDKCNCFCKKKINIRNEMMKINEEYNLIKKEFIKFDIKMGEKNENGKSLNRKKNCPRQ